MANRQRSMSGTIPSMETSGQALKDNTVIIGQSTRILSHRQIQIQI